MGGTSSVTFSDSYVVNIAYHVVLLKHTLKAFDHFENKQKSA